MKATFVKTILAFALAQNQVLGADVSLNGCDGAENQTSSCDLRVKVLGQSGKIVLGSENKTDAVTITMDSMTERNEAGEAVGTSGSVKHSFNSFASQEFTFGEPAMVEIGNATATAIDFTATLVDQATLTVTIFAIATDGVLEVSDTESFYLDTGSLKFNIEIENWPFCSAGGSGATSCSKGQTEEVGAYLDVDVIIKGMGEPAPIENDLTAFDLGDDITLDLSESVFINGVVQDMPEGFPRMELKGGKQVFTFRFPRFTGKATYDPVVSGVVAPRESPEDIDDGSTIDDGGDGSGEGGQVDGGDGSGEGGQVDGGDDSNNESSEINVNGCDGLETTSEACDLRVKVLGQSGKVVLSSADKQDAVTITMDSMTERDESGNEVGSSSSIKHSFNSFASQDFTFGTPSKVDVGNATATAIDFSATLVDQASLKVTIFAIATEGVIEVSDTESFELAPGSLKFNIEINDWPFCSAGGVNATLCSKGQNQEIGEFLDVDIIIKGKGETKAKANKTAAFDLGDSIDLVLSESISLNGAVQRMPEGFPKMELKGGKQVFTFRFPRFSGKATYDPVISGIVAAEVTSSASTMENSILCAVIALVSLVIRF